MYVILDLDRHLTHLIIIPLHFYTDNVKQGSPTVTLFVKPHAGKSHKIEISANSTVDQVKDAIEDLEAVPTSEQRLIFNGKEPDGQTSLSQLGISGWSTAELIVRGVGGVVDNPYAKKVQPAKKGRTYVSPGRRGGQGDRVVNGGRVVGRGAGRMSTPLFGRGRVSSQQARGTGRGHVTPPFQGRDDQVGGRGGRGASTRGSNATGRGRRVRGNRTYSSQQTRGTGRGYVTPLFQGLPQQAASIRGPNVGRGGRGIGVMGMAGRGGRGSADGIGRGGRMTLVSTICEVVSRSKYITYHPLYSSLFSLYILYPPYLFLSECQASSQSICQEGSTTQSIREDSTCS